METMKRVDVAPIRAAVMAFIGKGGTWTYICNELEWMETETKPESSRLQRCLGLRSVSTGGNSHRERYTYIAKRMTYENAIKILRAIEADPTDYGL